MVLIQARPGPVSDTQGAIQLLNEDDEVEKWGKIF